MGHCLPSRLPIDNAAAGVLPPLQVPGVKSQGASPTPEALKATITDFLAEWPLATVRQGGTRLFALDSVEWSISTEYRRCTLCFWAESLNVRRTVVDAQVVKGCLKLTTARMGLNKQQVLWLTPNQATHTFSSKDVDRLRYADLLRRLLDRLLEQSSGPFYYPKQAKLVKLERNGLYLRGIVKQGGQRWAVIGISRHERGEHVQGLLRHGITWLTKCRDSAKMGSIAGLKVFCPKDRSCPVQYRIAWFARPHETEFYEVDEENAEMVRVEVDQETSCSPDIVRAFNSEVLLERCREPLAELLELLPPGAQDKLDYQPLSPSLLAVKLNGVELASVCYAPEPGSFARSAKLYHCIGRKRGPLLGAEAKLRFKQTAASLFEQRDADAVRTTSLYRCGADAWLTKVVRQSIGIFEPSIEPEAMYQAVECSSCGISDSMDLLAVSRGDRLTIIHVRANENSLFPMHGLDQWIRLRELNLSGKLEEAGYFPSRSISKADPLLIFVAPALRLREDNETILRYLSRQVSWTYIAVDENWRHVSQVIYRKQSEKPQPRSQPSLIPGSIPIELLMQQTIASPHP